MLSRIPRTEVQKPTIEDGPINNQDILTTLRAVKSDPAIYRTSNIYQFIDLYKQQGVDIVAWYENHKKTKKVEQIQDDFLTNRHHGFSADLAELLPLFANAQGRVGDYFETSVTKTSKQDDQGNSFIDLVIEVKNTFLTTLEAPKELQDSPVKMTFLVDVTTVNKDSDVYNKKTVALRMEHLMRGEMANVQCYQNSFGDLGIIRPKILIAKQPDYLEKVGASLGDCITQQAGDKFLINKPVKFDEQYRSYFLDLMTSIGENAKDNISYMKSLAPDSKRQTLIREYEKIVAFVEAYKKTPLTRKRSA
jgi:hypothetical protein